MDWDRVARVFAAIDARNAGDPNTITVRGQVRPKELAHAELVTEWVSKLRPDAGEALLLAARAHHVRRWAIPRDAYPEGRAGYLDWRRALHDLHAEELRRILEAEGYDEPTIARAESIVRKRNLWTDPDVQTLEDALCLVFLETQFHDLSARLDHEKMIGVLRKTMRKMSPRAIELALGLEMAPEDRAMLGKAAR